MTTTEHHSPDTHSTRGRPLDLIIVGAGIAAVDLGHHVANTFPHWRWRVFDSNTDIGGTWETFRYPGIRSDSDMGTFCLPFAPWPHRDTLGAGANIQGYLREEARKTGMLERTQLRSWVAAANFHSDDGVWEVTVEVADEADGANSEGRVAREKTHTETHWTRRLHMATGYYRNSEGYKPDIPGIEDFRGEVIHPQQWTNPDVAGKNVVIIGSGATAVTLLPALHDLGANVTMLQRTPTYIAPLFPFDTTTELLKRVIPRRKAYRYARKIQILRDHFQYHFCTKFPRLGRAFFWTLNRRFVPASTIRDHFTPPYGPWEQRVCKSPGGDFFMAFNDGASVATGTIDRVTADGIRLNPGGKVSGLAGAPHEPVTIPADIIITATGLELEVFGNAKISVDGVERVASDMVAYRGAMMDGIPNFSTTVGYLNLSWTLRADLISRYLVRLWSIMADRGETVVTPTLPANTHSNEPLLGWSSGYIKRAEHRLPTQAQDDPWHYEQDYMVERRNFLGEDMTRDLVFR